MLYIKTSGAYRVLVKPSLEERVVLNRVKAYNNGGKTLLYSVETYRMSGDKYFAVTSDEIKRIVTVSGALEYVRPLSEGATREDAIVNLQHGISVITGVKQEDQSFIAIRHHDTFACYYCKHFPKFDTYEEWRHHYYEVHTPSIYPSELVTSFSGKMLEP